MWTFVIALGGAFAGFLVGQGLIFTGYLPDVAQSASAVLGIRLLIGPLPVILILLGNLAMLFYPLNQARYAQVQAEIQAMETAKETLIAEHPEPVH